MDDTQEAIDYIFSDIPPDGVFRGEALETHKELQHRKEVREKKHSKDYRFFKRDMIAKSRKKKNRNLYSYGKAI